MASLLDLVDRTEGGGNYSTLFGHSQRGNGRFAGVDVSNMTVGDAIRFSDPNGEYAQWVNGQIGRVATPMGRFQIVGTTLRNAVNELGIDLNTPFNATTQDRIAAHLAQGRLSGARSDAEALEAMRNEWEGLRHVSDAELLEAIRGFDPTALSTASAGMRGGQTQSGPAPSLDRVQETEQKPVQQNKWATPRDSKVEGTLPEWAVPSATPQQTTPMLSATDTMARWGALSDQIHSGAPGQPQGAAMATPNYTFEDWTYMSDQQRAEAGLPADFWTAEEYFRNLDEQSGGVAPQVPLGQTYGSPLSLGSGALAAYPADSGNQYGMAGAFVSGVLPPARPVLQSHGTPLALGSGALTPPAENSGNQYGVVGSFAPGLLPPTATPLPALAGAPGAAGGPPTAEPGGFLSISIDPAPVDRMPWEPQAPRPAPLSGPAGGPVPTPSRPQAPPLTGPAGGPIPNTVMRAPPLTGPSGGPPLPPTMAAPQQQQQQPGQTTGPMLSSSDAGLTPGALDQSNGDPQDPQNFWQRLGNFSRDNSDLLLAIGSGLLSGTNWQEGFAGAAQNVLALNQQNQAREDDAAAAARDQQYRLDQIAATQTGSGEPFRGTGQMVELDDGTMVPAVFNSRTGTYFSMDGTDLGGRVTGLVTNTFASGATGALTGNQAATRAEDIVTTQTALGRYDRLLTNLQDTKYGVEGAAVDGAAMLSTLFGGDVSEDAMRRAIASADTQALLGLVRTDIVGPGVMTEQDAGRIIAALGGDLSLMSNPQVMRELIGNLRADTLNRYNVMYRHYNALRAAYPQMNYGEIPTYVDPWTTPANAQAQPQQSAAMSDEDFVRNY